MVSQVCTGIAGRHDMSIHAVAQHTGLHWETVKDIEKAYWAQKYAKVRLGDVRRMGIDEVYLGEKFGFITIVRDLESGAVLYIGQGKGGATLDPLKRRLRRAKPNKSRQSPLIRPMPMLHSYQMCSPMLRLFVITSMSSSE